MKDITYITAVKTSRALNREVEEINHLIIDGIGIEVLFGESFRQPIGHVTEIRREELFKSDPCRRRIPAQPYRVCFEQDSCLFISTHQVYPYENDYGSGLSQPPGYRFREFGLAYNLLIESRIFKNSNLDVFLQELFRDGFQHHYGWKEPPSEWRRKLGIRDDNLEESLSNLNGFLGEIDTYNRLRLENLFDSLSFNSSVGKISREYRWVD